VELLADYVLQLVYKLQLKDISPFGLRISIVKTKLKNKEVSIAFPGKQNTGIYRNNVQVLLMLEKAPSLMQYWVKKFFRLLKTRKQR
jgi:hypothetical protein